MSSKVILEKRILNPEKTNPQDKTSPPFKLHSILSSTEAQTLLASYYFSKDVSQDHNSSGTLGSNTLFPHALIWI